MPTQKNGYFLSDGSRVPGTTTVLGRFKESGPLIRWAWNEGREGRELYETRDKAADIGTAAHSMVEARINQQDPEAVLGLTGLDFEGLSRARNAFRQYEKWASMSNLAVLHQEFPMVSEVYRFGGTPDAIGTVNGELCLVDWKTSNGVYADYLLQLAAYRILWEELNPDKPLVGGFHLCRFSKDYGDFSHHYYSELESAREMFIHLLAAYGYDKELKKRTS